MESIRIVVISIMLSLMFTILMPMTTADPTLLDESIVGFFGGDEAEVQKIKEQQLILENEPGIPTQADPGLFAPLETIGRAIGFIPVLVLMFLNSMITPLQNATTTAGVELIAWTIIGFFIVINNAYLMLTFYQLIFNKKVN